jgi:hypothetical protein
MTLSIITLYTMTLSLVKLRLKTVSVMAFSVMTHNIKQIGTHDNNTWHNIKLKTTKLNGTQHAL